jgi:hypothetical protein
MLRFLLPITLLGLFLPSLISAQCPACDSYTAALKSCQSPSVNVTAIGNTMDASTVHCMCVAHSNTAQMNTCQGCLETSGTTDILTVLLTWRTTCNADTLFGDQQAVACWEGQPGNILPCISKMFGNGFGSPTSLPGVTTSSAGR